MKKQIIQLKSVDVSVLIMFLVVLLFIWCCFVRPVCAEEYGTEIVGPEKIFGLAIENVGEINIHFEWKKIIEKIIPKKMDKEEYVSFKICRWGYVEEDGKFTPYLEVIFFKRVVKKDEKTLEQTK